MEAAIRAIIAVTMDGHVDRLSEHIQEEIAVFDQIPKNSLFIGPFKTTLVLI